MKFRIQRICAIVLVLLQMLGYQQFNVPTLEPAYRIAMDSGC
jgi:hypothetical protein